MHIPGQSLGKGAAADICCPMQLGLDPVHKHYENYETVKGTSKQDVIRHQEGSCKFGGNCWYQFGQGLCWADPLSALSTTF